ncbi:transposase, partial [Pseudomonas plecoglossicida]
SAAIVQSASDVQCSRLLKTTDDHQGDEYVLGIR